MQHTYTIRSIYKDAFKSKQMMKFVHLSNIKCHNYDRINYRQIEITAITKGLNLEISNVLFMIQSTKMCLQCLYVHWC